MSGASQPFDFPRKIPRGPQPLDVICGNPSDRWHYLFTLPLDIEETRILVIRCLQVNPREKWECSILSDKSFHLCEPKIGRSKESAFDALLRELCGRVRVQKGNVLRSEPGTQLMYLEEDREWMHKFGMWKIRDNESVIRRWARGGGL